MKRSAKVYILLAAVLCMAVGGFGVYKLYSMYKNVWNTLDYLAGAVYTIDRTREDTQQIGDLAAKVERLHRDAFYSENASGSQFDYDWVNEVPPYIAHACGGIDDKTYTNSKDAFLLNYELGHRVFEVDFGFSKDGVLIAYHDSAKWKRMIGKELERTIENFDHHLLYDKYETLNYSEIIDLMVEYPDAYIVTDTKSQVREEVMLAFSQLVYCAKQQHPEVLDRIIPQIYNEEMLSWICSIYPFKSIIYTLYATQWTPQSVLDFCINSGVRFITMPENHVSEETLRLWDTMNIHVAAHTVNDEQYIDELFDMGVDMIYTDFAVPD